MTQKSIQNSYNGNKKEKGENTNKETPAKLTIVEDVGDVDEADGGG